MFKGLPFSFFIGFLFWGGIRLSAQTNINPNITAPNPGQDPTKSQKIEIIRTDLLVSEMMNGREVRKLLGNVHIRQDTTDFFCDSAYIFSDSNFIQAFQNVRIKMSDSVDMYCDHLDYFGNQKIAELHKNVRIQKGKNTKLFTQKLTYNRLEEIAIYSQEGRIEAGENVLTSTYGNYYPQEDYAYFRKKVKLVNPEYTLKTDTLGYDTKGEVASFITATTITDTSGNKIYAEGGFFDTKLGLSFFYKNASLEDKDYKMQADTIYYDDKSDYGQAVKNIVITKKDSTLFVYGDRGYFRKDAHISVVTENPVVVQQNSDDTLYLFADSIMSEKDTTLGLKADSSKNKQVIRAYSNARFYMNQAQGIADSLVYNLDDSMIFLHKDPVLWSKETQLSGDTLLIWMKNKKVDSLAVLKNGFILTKEDTVGYNQIKGKNIHAKLSAAGIEKLWVRYQSENIYFIKDGEEYSGMNESKCNHMTISFNDGKPGKIVFYESPIGTYYPIEMAIKDKKRLDGFKDQLENKPDKPIRIGNQFQESFGGKIFTKVKSKMKDGK